MRVDTFIGARINAKRKLVGLSLSELALRLSLDEITLSACEAGEQRLSPEAIYEIALILHEPLSYFFPLSLSRSGECAEVDDDLSSVL